jgi:aminopeptidase N
MRLIIALLLFPSLLYAQSDIDVQHYRFQIELNDSNDTIAGRAVIRLAFTRNTDMFELDLVQASGSKKGMEVLNTEGQLLKRFETIPSTSKVRFHLAKTAQKGDTASFIIYYKGVPADGLIISKTKYGRRSFFADNWPNRGQNWLPCNDHPADKATVEFIVIAPDHYQVVANGLQVEESTTGNGKKLTHWKESVPISTKVMVIGVADFAVHKTGTINDCIPVYSWVYPEDREKGFSDYALAGKVLPFFIQYIGPYPYKKLANVQSKTMFGGLENANTIFYSESSVSGTGRSESLIAHEIAHQWFGNHATEKTFAHLWLSEGFATYMTILYFESFYGKDSATAMLVEDRREVIAHAKRSDRPVVDSLETDYMSLLNANSYEKGSFVLHMLRNELGDQNFKTAIRKYYSTYAGSVAGTEDLRKIFEEVSGKDLSLFFKQWLYTPGIPRLRVKWNYSEVKKNLVITVEQQQSHLFSFPLEIGIPGSDSRPIQLSVSKKSETFTIPFNSKPQELVVDPNTVLLFERL